MKTLEIADSVDHITEEAVESSAAKLIAEDSVLFVTRSGILAHTFPVARTRVRVTVNQDIKALTPNSAVNPDYVAWGARALASAILERCSKDGTTVASIDTDLLHRFSLPIAPKREQRRIVEAIESHFTRLDDAVATLERVQRNLKRYRASVLKAAVEGRLVPTEADLARAEGRDYEPASVLLERILAERPRGSEPPDVANLRELPGGWCWGSVSQIGEVSGGLTQNANRTRLATQLPFLRVANVYANELRLDEIKIIGVSDGEFERVRLTRGDLLIVEGNGSLDQIGRVAIWDGSIEPCLHQNHLIKVRFSPVQLGEWSLLWLLSPSGRVAIERAASSTSGLHTLSISKVERLLVPVPPLAEQVRIAAEVERLLSVSDAVAHEVAANMVRSPRLRQSILKSAFEGRLVDQDPTDEPVSALLERIKAERAATTAKRPARTAKRKSSPA